MAKRPAGACDGRKNTSNGRRIMKRTTLSLLALSSLICGMGGLGCVGVRSASAPSEGIMEVSEPAYIVEGGYPPGCYYVGDNVWWGGRSYTKQVFKQTIVQNNIR